MKKKSLIAMVASILVLLGTGSFSSPQLVSAAKHQIFVSSKTYVYDHKGKKPKKYIKRAKVFIILLLKRLKVINIIASVKINTFTITMVYRSI